MSKVIAFYCSPRTNGYTAQLMNQVLEGAKSAGAMETTHDFFKLCGWDIPENLLIYGDVIPDFMLSAE